MTMARRVTAVVKVIRGFPKNPNDKVPAMVIPRKGKGREQYIDQDVALAMGDNLVAYFEAEKIDEHWWIGQRLPDGDRGW